MNLPDSRSTVWLDSPSSSEYMTAMDKKKEWIKCSTIVVGFYLIVYVLLVYFFPEFFSGLWHLGLILICLVMAAADIWGLYWLISRYENPEGDDYP